MRSLRGQRLHVGEKRRHEGTGVGEITTGNVETQRVRGALENVLFWKLSMTMAPNVGWVASAHGLIYLVPEWD